MQCKRQQNLTRTSHNNLKIIKSHNKISWNLDRLKNLKNIIVSHKPHTLLLWAMGVHSISRILQHHLSTIFTSHHQHQTQTPDETLPSYNSITSRHIKSFSTIHIDLLLDISVTFATFHWVTFPLKLGAEENTVTRKEGRLHSKSVRKKRRRKEEPRSKYCDSPTEAKIPSNYIHHAINPNTRGNLHESQQHVQVHVVAGR
jgi:hypothetical protein